MNKKSVSARANMQVFFCFAEPSDVFGHIVSHFWVEFGIKQNRRRASAEPRANGFPEIKQA